MIKKYLSTTIALCFTLTLAGCSKNTYDFVTLPEYIGMIPLPLD